MQLFKSGQVQKSSNGDQPIFDSNSVFLCPNSNREQDNFKLQHQLCIAIVVTKVTACLLQLHMCGVRAKSDLNRILKYLFEPGLSWFSGIENL